MSKTKEFTQCIRNARSELQDALYILGGQKMRSYHAAQDPPDLIVKLNKQIEEATEILESIGGILI